jgi:hypothetical protein
MGVIANGLRWLFSLGRSDVYKSYKFPDPYNYERQGAFWTCEGCSRIARKYLSNGRDASRCEHCGRKGYWVSR